MGGVEAGRSDSNVFFQHPLYCFPAITTSDSAEDLLNFIWFLGILFSEMIWKGRAKDIIILLMESLHKSV